MNLIDSIVVNKCKFISLVSTTLGIGAGEIALNLLLNITRLPVK